MHLLPENLRQQLPKLYSQENVKAEEKTVYAKFFFADGNWTWFVTEGEEREGDFVFFGYVIGFEEEWGYFTLSELQNIDIGGLVVERDLYFKPARFADVIAQFRRERGQ